MYQKPKLRVHIAFMGHDVNRITDPLIRTKADKAYLVTHQDIDDTAKTCRDNVLKILHKKMEIEKRTTDNWNLFDCLEVYRDIMKQEEQVYINVSAGSKISSIAGILACMLYSKGIPYYAHIEYPKPLGNEKVTEIEELPVYPIGTPKPESLTLLKILSQAPEKKLKKHALIEKLVEAAIIDKSFSQAARHSRLKSLVNPATMDYPPQVLQRRVEVENKGRQSNVILTTQGENTLKIFGERSEVDMKVQSIKKAEDN